MSPRRGLVRALSAVVVGIAQPDLSAQSAEVDVRPQPFRRILYMNGGPARDDALFAAIRDLGFDALSVHSTAEAGLAEQHGFAYYRDQIVGKDNLELRDATWLPLRVDYLENRDSQRLVRPTCLSDTGVRAGLHAKAAERLAAISGNAERAPFAVCLGDEPSGTRRGEPLDVCFGPACVARFRQFLEHRYGGDLERLELTWGTDLRSWEDVRPFGADRIRARELRSSKVLPECLTPWSDHLEFRDALFAGLVSDLAAGIQDRFSIPAGITGMQAPSAYGGYDYARLMETQRFYEAYDIGGARDLARAFALPDAFEVATLLPPPDEVGAAAQPFVTANLLDLVLHGANGAIVWSCGRVFEAGPEAVATPYGRALANAFRETRRFADALAGARIERAPIWLVESQPSVRAHWMLDSIEDGATWPKRLTSHENRNSSSQAARESWVRVLQDLGHQPDFVSAHVLEDPEALRGAAAPSLLVLPATIALSDRAATAIRMFVARGGHVVADYAPARYDEKLRRRRTPALDDVFGIVRADGPTARPLVREGRVVDGFRDARHGVAIAERGIRGTDVYEDWPGLAHVQCEHAFERGRATYLNLAVGEYAASRLDPARLRRCRELRKRIGRIVSAAGVTPPVWVRGTGRPPFVETVVLRAANGRRYLVVRLHVLDSPALCAELVARGPVALELDFGEQHSRALVDLRSGDDLGVRRKFAFEIAVGRPLVLEMRAPEDER